MFNTYFWPLHRFVTETQNSQREKFLSGLFRGANGRETFGRGAVRGGDTRAQLGEFAPATRPKALFGLLLLAPLLEAA